jgi:hypothetical protein
MSFPSWGGSGLGNVQHLDFDASSNVLSLVPYGNSVSLNSDVVVVNDLSVNNIYINPSELPVDSFGTGIPNFGNTNTSGAQTALFVNKNTGLVQTPSNALIRLINLQVPDGGGSATLKDSNNNYYSSDDWVACCVGFSNSSGDRAYACYSTGISGNNWQITYTFAGTGSGVVQVLAIHKSLLGCYSPG